MDKIEDADLQRVMDTGKGVTDAMLSRERLNTLDIDEVMRALYTIQSDREVAMTPGEVQSFIEGVAIHIQWTHQRHPVPRYQEIPASGKKRKKALKTFVGLVHKWLSESSHAALTYDRKPATAELISLSNDVDLKGSSLVTITFKTVVPKEAMAVEEQGWVAGAWAWMRKLVGR